MAITRVAQQSAGSISSSINLAWNVASASNVFVAVVTIRSDSITPSVSGLGASWNLGDSRINTGSSPDLRSYIFLGRLPTAGSGTLTISFGSAIASSYWVGEYSGMARLPLLSGNSVSSIGNAIQATTPSCSGGDQNYSIQLSVCSVAAGVDANDWGSPWTQLAEAYYAISAAACLTDVGEQNKTSPDSTHDGGTLYWGTAYDYVAWAIILGGLEQISVSSTVPVASNVNGGVRVTYPISGTVGASSVISGTAKLLRRVSGTIASNSAATSDVKRRRGVSGNIDVVSGPSPATDVTVYRGVSGNVNVASGISPADWVLLKHPTVISSALSGCNASAVIIAAELIIDSLDISVAEGNGGETMLVIGRFPIEDSIRVYVGPTGTDADPQALSGKQGGEVHSLDGSTVLVYVPQLEPGIYSVYATNGTVGDVYPNSLTIVKANQRSGAFNLRNSFPPMFAVGPRKIDMVPT